MDNTSELSPHPETETIQLPGPILEIGPRNTLLRYYYDDHPDDMIVFVDLKPPAFRYQEYPNATYVQKDVVDYLADDEKIPEEGFKTMIALNVFGAPPSTKEGREQSNIFMHRLDEFISNAYKRLQPGGEIIIEETSTPYPMVKETIVAAVHKFNDSQKRELPDAAFDIEIVEDKSRGLVSRLWDSGAYQLRLKKK